MKEMKDVRAGNSQSRLGEQAFGIMAVEATAISIGAGYYFESWWVGGAVFVLMLVLMAVKSMRIPVALAFAVAWGAFGYVVGIQTEQAGAQFVIAGVAFLVGLGAHIAALEYAGDIGS